MLCLPLVISLIECLHLFMVWFLIPFSVLKGPCFFFLPKSLVVYVLFRKLLQTWTNFLLVPFDACLLVTLVLKRVIVVNILFIGNIMFLLMYPCLSLSLLDTYCS